MELFREGKIVDGELMIKREEGAEWQAALCPEKFNNCNNGCILFGNEFVDATGNTAINLCSKTIAFKIWYGKE